MILKMVRPDAKGRITLGHLAAGVSSFSVTETKDHTIILKPYTEIPKYEEWLFRNKVALKKIDQGLKDAAAGRVSKKSGLAKFINDDIE